MQRKDPHISHFQEFENFERDCLRLLEVDDLRMCLDIIERYLERHVSKSNRQGLVIHRAEYLNMNKEYRENTISSEKFNRRRTKLHYALINLVSTLQPAGYSDYEEGSLRRMSKWDERENLTVYIHFGREFNYLDKLFRMFEQTWKPFIEIEIYFLNEKGEEVVLKEDFKEEGLPTGIARGEKMVFPEDLDNNNYKEQNDSQDENKSLEIKHREWKDKNALRIKKNYSKPVLVVDEYGEEKMDILEEKAWAIIERIDSESKIGISAIGALEAKCALVNELLGWFEKHDLFAHGKEERFAVCIPQAVDFRSSESSPTEVSIFIKQPI